MSRELKDAHERARDVETYTRSGDLSDLDATMAKLKGVCVMLTGHEKGRLATMIGSCEPPGPSPRKPFAPGPAAPAAAAARDARGDDDERLGSSSAYAVFKDAHLTIKREMMALCGFREFGVSREWDVDVHKMENLGDPHLLSLLHQIRRLVVAYDNLSLEQITKLRTSVEVVENVHHLLAVGGRAVRAERRAVARAARTRHTHVADGAHRGLDSVNRVSPALAERIRRAQAEDRAHHHHQRR